MKADEPAELVVDEASLTAIIEDRERPWDERHTALMDRASLLRRQGRLGHAIAALTAIHESPEASEEERAKAVLHRARSKRWAGDLAGADADFTVLFGLADVSGALIARGLFERSLLREQQGRMDDAIGDLNASVIHPDATEQARGRSHLQLGNLLRKTDKLDAALDAYSRCIANEDSVPLDKAFAYRGRAKVHSAKGNTDAEDADIEQALALPGLSSDTQAMLYMYRHFIFYNRSDWQRALADTEHVLALEGVDPFPLLAASSQRAATLVLLERTAEAITQLNAIVSDSRPEEAMWQQAVAMRGFLYYDDGNNDRAMLDIERFLTFKDPNPLYLARILLCRGTLHMDSDPASALVDFDRVLKLNGIDADMRVQAHYKRAATLSRQQRYPAAIDAATAGLAIEGATAPSYAACLVNRGFAYFRIERHDLACADFIRALAIPEIPPDVRNTALWNLAHSKLLSGENKEAIVTYDRYLQSDGLSAANRSEALYNRAIALVRDGQVVKFQAELLLLVRDPNTPAEIRDKAQADLDGMNVVAPGHATD